MTSAVVDPQGAVAGSQAIAFIGGGAPLVEGVLCLVFVSLALALGLLVRRWSDLRHRERLLAYLGIGVFLLCAAAQVASILTLWGVGTGVRDVLLTGAAGLGVFAAVLLWRYLPSWLAGETPKDLVRLNQRLLADNQHLNTVLGQSRGELHRINSRFALALTGSNISVFTQDRELRYTWVYNPWLGYTDTDFLGKTDIDVLPQDVADDVMAMKRQVIEQGEAATRSVAVTSPESGTLLIELVVHPTYDSDGEIDGVLCTAIDMTEKNLYEIRLTSLASELAEANHRFETALDGSLITVFEQDATLTYLHIVNPSQGLSEDQVVGKTDADLLSEEDQLKVVPIKRQVLESGEGTVLEVDVTVGDGVRNYNLRLDPVKDAHGVVTGLLGTAVDMTDKRENERHMRMVMRELTHRSKNLLAVIQAMARQTAARADTTEDFVEGFTARLQAMAASHDLLVSRSWSGADIRDLVVATVSQTVDPSTEQVEIIGPAVSVTADAAQSLGLALHELTTNAAKYGALSVPDGHLIVSWESCPVMDGDNEAEGLVLRWMERGGPPVSSPTRTGFGRMLIEQLVGPTLGGTVEMTFAEDGVTCMIPIAASRLTRHTA